MNTFIFARKLSRKVFYLLVSTLLISTTPTFAKTQFNGVNLAGADFGYDTRPGDFGTHYTYPTHAEVDYFMGKGMNIFRLPFLWERLQNDQNGPLNSQELARIKDFVAYVSSKQGKVILDPHNSARYYDEIIGIDGDLGALPVAAFKDFWTKLANEFKNNQQVIFGLMNEPHDMPSELWRDDANAAIVAIRATGAKNLILVPGNAWTGAHSWNDNSYGTPNGVVMKDIADSANNYAFEVHQYMDTDSSGSSANCVSQTIGAERLVEFTNWLRSNKQRGFLGEFAGGRNATCLSGIDKMLDYVDANDDVWLGWTYWAAGPWWGEDIFTLEPKNGVDRPQMAELLKHISSGEPTVPPVVAPSPSPTPTSSANTLTPIDDVNNSASEDGRLAVSKWEHAFLRFDVSSLRTQLIKSAHLRVYHQGQLTPLTLSVNEAEHDNWTEEETNPPGLVNVLDDPGLILDSVVVSKAGYIEFDVTGFVDNETNNDGMVSLELSSNHDNWSFVDSKEGNNTPQLVLQTAVSSPENTPADDRAQNNAFGSGGGSLSIYLLFLLFFIFSSKWVSSQCRRSGYVW